ncbi:SDR family NAD(P)-dependent oxidoreductase [Natronoflexus pectinivorans]|uniref:NAD(P)-dependent dehydrogenase (Short-subunit alcohol dehydrogenase family) n=1 Tax=Natronoflexus pectinivorans TaxID=682526 RepID=A0A4V6NMN4_9BACT|nr:SDR family oxidoreductase [Natronoflexus pectinivorans]TCO05994.1 NAD(P)-dependent dehydrogenase (short-subunit alcohol dehydrogenase family) [Natronoflexus pectinivorans]
MTKKVFLITGGSSGIGLAAGEVLANEGNHVISMSRSMDKVERAINEQPNLKGKLDFITADVANREDVEKVYHYINEKFGLLHGIVNSAGVIAVGSLETVSIEDWQKMMDVNLTGPFMLVKTMLPLLRKANGASVVNISSIAGLRPGTSIAYSVSKAGLDMLTRFLAGDLGPYNIRVNSVNPGLVKTNIHFDNNIVQTKEQYEEMVEKARLRHPLRRVGRKDDIASIIRFLMSDESSWISGAIIPVDGGVTQENNFIPRKD